MEANNLCHTLLLINFGVFLLFASLFIFSLLSVLQRSASMALALQFKTFSSLPSGGQVLGFCFVFFCFVSFCYEETSVVNHWNLAAKFYLKQTGFELNQRLSSSSRSCRSRVSAPFNACLFPTQPQNSGFTTKVCPSTPRQTDVTQPLLSTPLDF